MKFTPTKIPGAYLIEIQPITDDRGFFARSFCANEFQQHGLNSNFVQCNVSFTAQRGLVEIRMRRGDVPGTKTALERLVKLNPENKQYKEFLAAVNKQINETKKVGTLKPTEPAQPSKSSK